MASDPLSVFDECIHELVRCAVCHAEPVGSVNDQLDSLIQEALREQK